MCSHWNPFQAYFVQIPAGFLSNLFQISFFFTHIIFFQTLFTGLHSSSISFKSLYTGFHSNLFRISAHIWSKGWCKSFPFKLIPTGFYLKFVLFTFPMDFIQIFKRCHLIFCSKVEANHFYFNVFPRDCIQTLFHSNSQSVSFKLISHFRSNFIQGFTQVIFIQTYSHQISFKLDSDSVRTDSNSRSNLDHKFTRIIFIQTHPHRTLLELYFVPILTAFQFNLFQMLVQISFTSFQKSFSLQGVPPDFLRTLFPSNPHWISLELISNFRTNFIQGFM